MNQESVFKGVVVEIGEMGKTFKTIVQNYDQGEIRFRTDILKILDDYNLKLNNVNRYQKTIIENKTNFYTHIRDSVRYDSIKCFNWDGLYYRLNICLDTMGVPYGDIYHRDTMYQFGEDVYMRRKPRIAIWKRRDIYVVQTITFADTTSDVVFNEVLVIDSKKRKRRRKRDR